jgi:hypothetical protein
MKDILKSGVLGLGTAALANNPEMLRGFGLVGNLAADKMDDREKKKRKEAMLAAVKNASQIILTTVMKKGGAVKKKSVSSASKRADGIAIKGKTRGKMV